MDGHWVPPGLQLLSPWWKNHLENITLVQFQHRMVALLVWAATCVLALSVRRAGLPRLLGGGLLAAVCLQFMLGVATLLSVVNLWIASAHQLGALLLFGIILRFCYLCPLDANQRPSEKQA